MTFFQKVLSFLAGVLMIIFSVFLITDPANGFDSITSLLSTSMIVFGIKSLWYYFTMARHMVGGLSVLFKAVIMLDFGVFTFSLTSVPRIYVLFYLLMIHAFGGLVDLLRGLEARKMGSPSWKLNTISGVTNFFMALTSLILVRSIKVLVIIYSIGLVYSGMVRIVSAFRKTKMVYIP